jgi:SAM-dependent methyltransferase
MELKNNIDPATVEGFGDEWTRFDQSKMSPAERSFIFATQFDIFPWDALPSGAIGCDIGCGSGRWSNMVAPMVGHLHCVEPSSAIEVAKRILAPHSNVSFHNVGVDDLPMADSSLDFAYSLGVLHHIPDTALAMKACVNKLKPGAPFLVYLYYRFDNRPAWYQRLWQLSETIRSVVSRQNHSMRYAISQIIAGLVYWPIARGAALGEKAGINVKNWPLVAYRHRSFYVMRTDALDRFGTQLEHRFTRVEIEAMMQSCGLENIKFSDGLPFWVAVGTKRLQDKGTVQFSQA